VRIEIRPERPADHRAVELLTREAFWGTGGPRCTEHLVVRRLRHSPALVPELSLVAEADGTLAGHVVWTRARVVGPEGTHEVLTFGPLSVRPDLQGRGVGGLLLRRTTADAAELGYRAVVVYGHPDYYPRFGFRPAADVGITAPGGATFDALMARPLVPGGLDGIRGELHTDPAFEVAPEEAEALDVAAYPPKEPVAPTPLADLPVPDDVVAALAAAGLVDVWGLRRRSAREVAAVPGVGEDGMRVVAAALRARGVPWGPADG
jgi:predicted N-acetyltransferase YhbS